MNFRLFYDAQRGLLAIGYRPADAEGPGRLDTAYYDLLASEAWLASFVAIAKGDAPQEHWFHLGRKLTPVDGSRALISWTTRTQSSSLPMSAATARAPSSAAAASIFSRVREARVSA